MITNKEVIEVIGKGLETKLFPYSFKFVKSKQHLLRKYDGGFDRILLYTITGAPFSHQELGLQFMSRIDTVEEIVEKFYDDRFRNMKFSKSSTTFGTEYLFLKKDGDKAFFQRVI